jgi:hypothetical protein
MAGLLIFMLVFFPLILGCAELAKHFNHHDRHQH